MLESSATSVALGEGAAGGADAGKEAAACTGGGATADPPAGLVRMVTLEVISLQLSQARRAFELHVVADISCNLRCYLRVASSSVARATSSGATSSSILIFILAGMEKPGLEERFLSHVDALTFSQTSSCPCPLPFALWSCVLAS
jgi:hypothetical protein